MPPRKTVTAISDELLARRDAEITRRLNELFADPKLAQGQAREASSLDAVGTNWNDERW